MAGRHWHIGVIMMMVAPRSAGWLLTRPGPGITIQVNDIVNLNGIEAIYK
jgi:hypothetical protein